MRGINFFTVLFLLGFLLRRDVILWNFCLPDRRQMFCKVIYYKNVFNLSLV